MLLRGLGLLAALTSDEASLLGKRDTSYYAVVLMKQCCTGRLLKSLSAVITVLAANRIQSTHTCDMAATSPAVLYRLARSRCTCSGS